MTHEEKLPWELIEEILSRVPPRSLVRFRIVSKQWNALFNDKTFINNHKTTFRFILATNSKMYTVSINPTIEVRELDMPGLEFKVPNKLIDFNRFMLCGMDKETLVWNPWLKQTKRIKLHVDKYINVRGIGYDDVNRSYKILASGKESTPTETFCDIGDFDSYVWQSRGVLKYVRENPITLHNVGENPITFHNRSVLLDGNLYWVASYKKAYDSMFCLLQFDFSTEKSYKYCDLACGDQNHHVLILEVFKGDRFSLLKQCHVSKKIEIWVTKNKIHRLYGRGRNVEWMIIMDVSIPNLPCLNIKYRCTPGYFIDDDKRLVVCSCDETGHAWIYVYGNKKFISKTQLDLDDFWPVHYTFFPSLVEVPRGQIVKSWKEVLLGSLRP